MSIKYSNYVNLTDYINRSPMHSTIQNYYANNLTLIRSALIVGLAPKGQSAFTRELVNWKISTIIAFINTMSPFTIQNIEHLETSERITVAYFIGMVFAQMYIQNHYGVRHLEHLKNRGISPTSLPGDLKNPDLWGYNPKTMISYLVEAKGSTTRSEYFENKYIRKAESQLRAITQIDYTVSGRVLTFNRTRSNLEKLIVATHPNLNNEIMQHVIDPSDEEDRVIKIDSDELVYKYYLNLIKAIKVGQSRIININAVPNVKFRVIELKEFEYSIGVIEEIYSLFEIMVDKDRLTQNDLKGVNKSVNSYLDDIEDFIQRNARSESYSIGVDGTIILAKN